MTDHMGSIYGTRIPRTRYSVEVDLIAEPELSGAGNVILPVGRELPGGGWTKVAHVALTTGEAIELATRLVELVNRAENR